MPEKPIERKRMVVEEVGVSETPISEDKKVHEKVEPEILPEAAKDTILTEPEKEPRPNKRKKSCAIALWIIIPGIFFLGAILGGIVFYQRGVNRGEVDVAATPTPSVTTLPVSSTTPSSTPTPTISLSKYSITVFNGSGIPGEAGKAKTLLTTAGFNVGSTSNAATYDYTKTLIKAKSTIEPAFVSALSAALGKTYVVDTPQTLASSSADTVQVVIGSSKAR
ncbi:MAG TPA: LytR C-terminal domain-containing protein [Candidatus Saccharimonadales bacterium]|jgi:hypothetical protein|nr:LytR C-terminal domain-containing protein [Candidatus Saccharimonadales bacterium]